MYVFTSDCVRREFDHAGSCLLTSMLDVHGDVPLPNVDSATLDKLSKWRLDDDDVIDESWDVLWKMAHAADYLDMPVLLDRTCKELALQLKGKSPTDILRMISAKEYPCE